MTSSRWMFEEVRGEPRMEQYIRTLLLRLQVRLFWRRWRRVKRRFLNRWMS